MKLLDKIWQLLGLVDTEDSEETPPVPKEKPAVLPEKKIERLTKYQEKNKTRRNPQPEVPLPDSNISLPAKTPTVSNVPHDAGGGKGQLAIAQPTGFDDARQIAENVTNGKVVVVNFEKTDEETIKRTVDFMSGITYAVGGTVQRISSMVFLFAPARVEVFSSERFAAEEQAMLPWRRS